MRLREMHHRIAAVLPRLKLRVTPAKLPNGEAGGTVHNLSHARAALSALREVPGVEQYAEPMLQEPVLGFADGLTLPMQLVTAFSQRLEQLRANLADVLTMLGSLLGDESPLSIAVRIPDVTTLDALDKTVRDLTIALHEPAKRMFGEKEGVSFSHVEQGSNWLILLASGDFVLTFIGTLLGYAAIYRKRELEAQRTEAGLRALNANAKLMEDTGEAIRKGMNTLCEQLAEQARGNNADPELPALIMNSIKTLSKLYGAGAEVHRGLLEAGDGTTPAADFPQPPRLIDGLADPTPLLSQDAPPDGETPDDEKS